MCAIVDASVAFEVFGRKRTLAGIRFRDWLDDGRGQLVVGGRVLDELVRNRNFERWLLEARRMSGRVRQIGGARIRHTRPDGHFTAEHRALLDAKELCVRPKAR